MAWSKKLIEITREKAGDGAMLKNEHFEYGFYATRPEGGIKLLGVNSRMGFPLPSDEVIAVFADIEEMLEAGWVLD